MVVMMLYRVKFDTVLGEDIVESCTSDGELVIKNVNGSGDADTVRYSAT
jgi:hypothetical protein